MMFIWVIILGLIVWGIFVLAKRGGWSSTFGEKKSPLDIAKERYARGEISKEEFERIKRDIM